MRRTALIIGFTVILIMTLGILKVYAEENGAELPFITHEQAMELAMHNSPNIKNIEEIIFQADVLVGKARAIFLPTLRANASLTRNNQEISLEFPDPSVEGSEGEETPTMSTTIQEELSKNYSISAGITLFNARAFPLYKYARRNVNYAKLTGNHGRNEILLHVSNAYYQILASEELVKVSNENLITALEFQKLSEAKKRVGQATKIDVLRAKSQVLDAENTKNNAMDSVDLARTALMQLIGISGKFKVTKPKPVSSEEAPLHVYMEHAIEHRQDYKAAIIALDMVNFLKKDVINQWIPAFGLTYNWNWNSAEGFAGENDSWNVQLGATWSIFEGGSRLADLRQKKSELRIAENNLDQLERNIRQEVESSFLEVNRRKRNLEFSKKQEEVAQETHYLIKRQYEEGMATSLDVLDAYSKYTGVRINRVVEQLFYDIALMSLNISTGEYFFNQEAAKGK